jgi:surface antigen
MARTIRKLAPLLAASLVTSACATKRETGAVGGAVGGAAVGGIIGGSEGALIGAALGGLLGYGAGLAMEEEDRRRVAYALEANQPMRWENPETGYEYEVIPERTVVERGRECRQFRMLADIDGQPESVYGTACRQPDGSWEVLSG